MLIPVVQPAQKAIISHHQVMPVTIFAVNVQLKFAQRVIPIPASPLAVHKAPMVGLGHKPPIRNMPEPHLVALVQNYSALVLIAET